MSDPAENVSSVATDDNTASTATAATTDATTTTNDDVETATTTTDETTAATPADGPDVSFKVSYLKKMFDVSMPETAQVSDLKRRLTELCGVDAKLQKVMFKGVLKDDVTLREAKVAKGSKLMMLATVVASAEALAATKAASTTGAAAAASSGPTLVVFEPMEKQVRHAKILAKGKPDDALPGHAVRQDALPSSGITGLYSHRGVKVRLTFKTFEQTLVVSSSENTQRIGYGAIREIKAEKMRDNEGYSIVNLVMGSGTVADSANYFLYWVPTNFVNAIKDEILGKFM